MKIQISQPKEKNSYNKHILDSIKANNENKPFIIDLQNQHKQQNIWMAFIDNEKYNEDEQLKIIIIVYHGEKKENIEQDIQELKPIKKLKR